MSRQLVETVLTIVPARAERSEQRERMSERTTDLEVFVRQGYAIATTVTQLAGADVLVIDTLTRSES